MVISAENTSVTDLFLLFFFFFFFFFSKQVYSSVFILLVAPMCSHLQVEAEKYLVGVAHLREVLFDIQFSEERIQVLANKLVNDVSR